MAKLNKQKVERAERVLQSAETLLSEPSRMSAGVLWRQDVVALRYVLDKLRELTEKAR